MLYRKYGKTNETVSLLGFGCMRLPLIGTDQTQIDEEKAIKMIHYAIEEGVNYIDTAYPYHGTGMGQGGQSEPFVAKALKGGYRERVKLATKLPSWLIKTREDMDKYLNEQLKRLETDYIDFYLVHALDKGKWDNLQKLGIGEFLDQALKDGRIKHAGFSFHDKLETFKEIVDGYDWSFCQIQLNYLDENFQAGKEGLEYAAGKGLGIAIMEPLRGGKLVRDLPEDVIKAFNEASVKRSPADWALRWVMNHPEVSVVLSGMSTMKNVVDNIKVASEVEPDSFTEEDTAVMNKVKGIYKSKIKNNCTACGYCMPCPFGVDIPQSFSYYNEYYMLYTPETEASLKARYDSLKPDHAASKCVECGLCETHCPQGIKIREDLKKVKALFE